MSKRSSANDLASSAKRPKAGPGIGCGSDEAVKSLNQITQGTNNATPEEARQKRLAKFDTPVKAQSKLKKRLENMSALAKWNASGVNNSSQAVNISSSASKPYETDHTKINDNNSNTGSVASMSASADIQGSSVVYPSPSAITKSAIEGHGSRESTGSLFDEPPQFQQSFLDHWNDIMGLRTSEPTGIRNRLNQCYRNSVYTALISSPNLMHYVSGWYIRMTNREGVSTDREYDLLCHLHTMANASENYPKILPSCIREVWESMLKKEPISPIFETWDQQCVNCKEQHDAAEFLQWILSVIGDDLSYAFDDASETSQPGSQTLDRSSARERFDWVVAGRFVERAICPNFPDQSRRRRVVNSDFLFSLNLPSASPAGLWRRNVQLESLVVQSLKNDPEEYNCDTCKMKHANFAFKQFTRFQTVPAVLLFRLNRSSSSVDGEKNLTAVQIPEILDISEHLNAHQYGPGSQITYKLVAVIAHNGADLHQGHYVSYVNTDVNGGTWYRMNDLNVEACTFQEVADSDVNMLPADAFESRFTPYVLIYDKIFPGVQMPGRSPRNPNISAGKQAADVMAKALANPTNIVEDDTEQGKASGLDVQDQAVPSMSTTTAKATAVSARAQDGQAEALESRTDTVPGLTLKHVPGTEADLGSTKNTKRRANHRGAGADARTAPRTAKKLQQRTSSDANECINDTAVEDAAANTKSDADHQVGPTAKSTVATGTASSSVTATPANTTTTDASTQTAPTVQVSGLAADGSKAAAMISLTLKIGKLDIPLPAVTIDHFDQSVPRAVELSAVLTAPLIQTVREAKKDPNPPNRDLDLISTALEPTVTTKRAWKSRWKSRHVEKGKGKGKGKGTKR